MRSAAFAWLVVAGCSVASPPNVILVLADDLGAYELGCYGQTKIRTPHIDALAKAGVRFTQFYAGAPVCAPSRCALLTGKHMGHAAIRDNREVQPEGQAPLPADEVTLARVLQDAGYAVGGFGKWGLGMVGTPGDPLRHGFDRFFGYHCQRHAHSHYPKYLRDGVARRELDGSQFSHDLIEAEALQFVRANRSRPFFVYLPAALPHLALQVPERELAEYRGKFPETPYDGKKGYRPHPTPRAAYAAMVTRLDATVGKLVSTVEELGLSRRTLILFTSDNGPTFVVGGADSDFFGSAGPHRGRKGQLYEGGLRAPLVASWPGRIPAGRVVDSPAALWDLLPTLCAAAGLKAPPDLDGIDLMPSFTGVGVLAPRDTLYWESPAGGGWQAARRGPWKAVRRPTRTQPNALELYDLATDPGETRDLAGERPDVAEQMRTILRQQHRPSRIFPLPGIDPP